MSVLPPGCVSDTGGVVPGRQSMCNGFCMLSYLVQRGWGSTDEEGSPLGKSYGLGLNVIFNVLTMRSFYLLRVAALLVLHRCCAKPLCALDLALLPN